MCCIDSELVSRVIAVIIVGCLCINVLIVLHGIGASEWRDCCCYCVLVVCVSTCGLCYIGSELVSSVIAVNIVGCLCINVLIVLHLIGASE